VPAGHIPVTVGGVGERTLEIARAHADWWDPPIHHRRGVERFYVWFADFAPVPTLERFAEVIGRLPLTRNIVRD
jgi:alkanesulfonate monooxygenase SsuD/methylene tetrahydromethanopterin reductase-like flavin-dependent oxidoreductase (luciferase family)